ncbi:heterokaryon incompatibility protein-domain-containing protein [Verticillium dahliae]|nr:heterokaryon incompatibility protein-domain-containing protein [Verticillium dahliae]
MAAIDNIYAKYPLIPNTRCFRILHLEPSVQDNDTNGILRGSLSVASLEGSKRSYETISYVWGLSSLPKSSILISGIRVPITSSLASVLRQLRRSNQVARLWADALCINQASETEKQHQVQLMADIYELSSQVNVWLLKPEESLNHNPPSKEMHADLGGLMAVLSADHFHSLPKQNPNGISDQPILADSDQLETLWRGFDYLSNSPWWTRGWTAQEAFLPPKVIFLHRDAESCSLDIMLKCINRFWTHTLKPRPCCIRALEVVSAEQMKSLWDFFQRLRKLQYRRELRTSQRRPDGRDKFYFIVSSFTDRVCKDHRDHIYSLWSLAGRSYSSITPRYDIPQNDAVMQVFECMLEEARSSRQIKWTWGMDFSVFQAFDFGPSSEGTRPSWVPDFNKKWDHRAVEVRLERVGQARLYQTSGWSTGRATVKGKELHIIGFKIDTIKAREDTSRDSHDSNALREVLAKWKALIQRSELANWQTDDALRIRFASLLCADTSHDRLGDREWAAWSLKFFSQMLFRVNIVRLFCELGFKGACRSEYCRRFIPEECPALEDLILFVDSGDLGFLRDERFLGAVKSCISYRSLYLTTSGKLGLCTENAQAGDEVWGILGSRVPFILRPLQDHGITRTYNLIGDCFLEGGMDGKYSKRGTMMNIILK